jgi:aspartyl-tRNA(Asn)/glutamyl-tRNA(Gln) amidotransferase subunit A
MVFHNAASHRGVRAEAALYTPASARRLTRMPDHSLWHRSAAELTAAYAQGEATPEAALDSVLARLEQVNGTLNAVICTDPAGARDAAQAAGQRWRAGTPLGPLDGVPITVKDNLFVGGLRATWGSLLYAHHVAPRDDLAVAALRAAGVVILGKTNTPELALSGHTDNRLFGSTGNPWDLTCSAGGSSGGAVAAVAGGIGPIALVSDAGGSTRRPAGLTGLLGLKPGVGRVPRRYGFPALAHDLQVIGTITRCVADLRAVFAAISTGPGLPPRDGALRIAMFDGFPAAFGGTQVDPAVKAAFDAGIAVLRGLGHRVETVAPFWDPQEAGAIFAGLTAAGVARVVRPFPDWRERVTPNIAALADAALSSSAADYVAVLDRLAVFRWSVTDAFTGFDLLATPTAAAANWPRTETHPATIDGRPAPPRAAAVFSTAVNLAGLPALSIPAPVPSGAMPIGLQLVALAGGEERLLHLAAAYEAAAPWPCLAPLAADPSPPPPEAE